MAERTFATERWIMGSTFTALMLALMLAHMVPLTVSAGRIPGPDLLIACTLAWVLRRPHYVPTLLIGVLFLLADVFFMRPLGLYAALVVLAVEFLRVRTHVTREQTFPAEWIMVAALLFVVTLINRMALGIFLVEQPAFGLELFQTMATVIVYPLVVFACRMIFGISKMSAAEAEARGRV